MRILVLAAVAALAVSGCRAPMFFERSISVERDPDGKVLKTVVTERILQQISGYEELTPSFHDLKKTPEPPPPSPLDYGQ